MEDQTPSLEQIDKEWAARIRVWRMAGWLDGQDPPAVEMALLRHLLNSIRAPKEEPKCSSRTGKTGP